MPPATSPRNVRSKSTQERSHSDDQPHHLATPQSTHQQYSRSLTTLPIGRSMKESGSVDRLPPLVTNDQQPRTSHQDYTDPWQPAAAMFQGARGVNIHGQPHFINIMNQQSYPGDSQVFENFRKFVSFNALHDSSVQEFDRQVNKVIREETLKRLRGWIDNPIATEDVIWLHGPASIGKTAIALEIARTWQQKVAATFFFYRPDASRNDGNRLFTTLAWQLAVTIPDIKNHVIHSLNERPDLLEKSIEAQFQYLVVQPFAAMKEAPSAIQPSDLVIVIDGVDECSNPRLQQKLLTVIGNAIQDRRVPLRFIISSRPEAHIQETFDQFQFPVLSIDLAKFGPAEEIKKREEELRKREAELERREQELERREAGSREKNCIQEEAEKLMHDADGKLKEEHKLKAPAEEVERREEDGRLEYGPFIPPHMYLDAGLVRSSSSSSSGSSISIGDDTSESLSRLRRDLDKVLSSHSLPRTKAVGGSWSLPGLVPLESDEEDDSKETSVKAEAKSEKAETPKEEEEPQHKDARMKDREARRIEIETRRNRIQVRLQKRREIAQRIEEMEEERRRKEEESLTLDYRQGDRDEDIQTGSLRSRGSPYPPSSPFVTDGFYYRHSPESTRILSSRGTSSVGSSRRTSISDYDLGSPYEGSSLLLHIGYAAPT